MAIFGFRPTNKIAKIKNWALNPSPAKQLVKSIQNALANGFEYCLSKQKTNRLFRIVVLSLLSGYSILSLDIYEK